MAKKVKIEKILKFTQGQKAGSAGIKSARAPKSKASKSKARKKGK